MTSPPDIVTALSPAEAEWLRQAAEGKRCLEIGSWTGFSACLMGRVAEHVVAVDHHRGDWAHPGADTLAEFMANLERHDLLGKVTPIVQRSEIALPLLADCEYDLVFVDGNHDYEHVTRDAILAWPLLREGGRMVFHDYYDEGDLEVKAAVDSIFRRHARIRKGPDSIVWVPKLFDEDEIL